MKNAILLIGGPSSSGKSTAIRGLTDKIKGTTLVLGFDLLLSGDEGDSYRQHILSHSKYQELLSEFYDGKRVNIFQAGVRDLLGERNRAALEAKFEALLDEEGAKYKNKRLVELIQEGLKEAKYILLDVLDPAPLAELLKEKKLPVKVAFFYVPIGQYLKRLRKRNQEAQSFEKPFCDPFGLVLRYSKYFVLSAEKGKRSIEKLSVEGLRKIYDQAVDDFKTLFSGMAELYKEVELKSESIQMKKEIELLDMRKKTAIEEELKRLNPDDLLEGFLDVRPMIQADLYLNTDQLSSLQVVDKLLKLITV